MLNTLIEFEFVQIWRFTHSFHWRVFLGHMILLGIDKWDFSGHSEIYLLSIVILIRIEKNSSQSIHLIFYAAN